jgi:hypothetical protein
VNIDAPEFTGYFLEFSAAVTGFSQFHLQGTGQAALYFNTVRGIVGGQIFEELLQTFHDYGVDAVLMSGKLGPIARNIIKLWYIATWEQLHSEWRERFGVPVNDGTFIAAPYAYPEALVWSAIGVNPPGAKAQGYGTWSDPPSVSLLPQKNA